MKVLQQNAACFKEKSDFVENKFTMRPQNMFGICNTFLLRLSVLVIWIHTVLGTVEIVKPYHPLYVKVGDTLEIKCISDERRRLEWVRQTPATTWRDTLIEPQIGGEFVIRYMQEEPTGYVESVLIKRNIGLEDRGMYICRDQQNENSFSVWVTSLLIYAQNVTAVEGSPIVLHCDISGFDTNPPDMDPYWKKGDKYLQTELSDRYAITMESMGRLQLTITEPGRSDTGMYTCEFTLYTNIMPLIFSEKIYVDATGLSNPGSGGVTLLPAPWWLTATLLVTLRLVMPT